MTPYTRGLAGKTAQSIVKRSISMNKDRSARLRGALVMLVALLWLVTAGRPALAQTSTPIADETGDPTETPSSAERPTDIRFGVIESYEDPARASQLGAAWTRVRFQWADVQPDGPDDWQPPIDDETLAAELAAGREVVGLLIGVPGWARDRTGVPRGLALAPDAPGNTWAVFVGDIVARYAGRIDRWIIWNEPDIADRDAPGHTWDGTLEQFVQLQRTAYLAAKAANPDAFVHLGAFTYFWDPGYFDRFLDLVAADPEAAMHNYYFDVATAHLYFQPNAVYNVLYALRSVLDDHGLDQPLWLVETNAPPMNDPYWVVPNWTLAVGLHEQAAFIPQALAAALAAGAERVAVYKLKDTADDRQANPEPFGLLRWDDSRRPAFDTYFVAIRRMAGATAAERERWDSVGQVRLEQPGQTTTVLFARLPDPQRARVPAMAETAELVDMWGKRETIEASGDTFIVDLPGALCLQTIADYCMIGGTTYYLIQSTDGRRAATPRPTSTTAATSAPASTKSAPTTAPPTPTATAVPSATPTALAPTVPAPTANPTATPLPISAGETTAGAPPGALPNYMGLIVIGSGLILAAGLAGWWLVGQRQGR